MPLSTMTVADLLKAIQSGDGQTRVAAWMRAGDAGPDAIPGLGRLAASDDRAIAKAALQALGRVTHAAAVPGNHDVAAVTSSSLLDLAESATLVTVRSRALFLVGHTADGRNVRRLEALLNDAAVRDDARMALERVPGSAAERALQRAAEDSRDGAWRFALEQSLRARRLSGTAAGRDPVWPPPAAPGS
ncbi:MAG: hypothetical protein KGJ62_12510 [Armatimonadetes bacterium]|nr:hypothetical protein [Armatimonadota bacterium]MDE2206912.1 hypothetical protein [Armatimonadota bacterium]